MRNTEKLTAGVSVKATGVAAFVLCFSVKLWALLNNTKIMRK
jgi:hypothetical protein